jgi:hypothetical protein
MFFELIGGIFPSILSIFRAIFPIRGISPLILVAYLLAILKDLEIANRCLSWDKRFFTSLDEFGFIFF